MQDIYNYIPEKNCCIYSVITNCAKCNVISLVKHIVHCYISTFRSLCAVQNMTVVCSFLT